METDDKIQKISPKPQNGSRVTGTKEYKILPGAPDAAKAKVSVGRAIIAKALHELMYASFRSL